MLLDATSFHRDGFAIIEQLVDQEVVDELRAAYDEIIDLPDGVRGDRLLGGLTRQVMFPSEEHPSFRSNAALDAAYRAIEPIMRNPSLVFDMLIYKPPGHEHATPWHQDVAYSGRPAAPAGTRVPPDSFVQFWVALDDVDEENGCMHFLPGHHRRPSLAHEVVGGAPDDDSRLLAVSDIGELDLRQAVPVALRAGGATVHSYGTPHYTPPNRSASRPRRAYIFTLAHR